MRNNITAVEALEKIKEKINDVRDEVNPYINEDDCNYFTNIIDEISLDIECLIEQALAEQEDYCYYKQLLQLKERNEQLEKFQDETWEFLNSIGISAGGELRMVKHIISTLKAENEQLTQKLEKAKEALERISEIEEAHKSYYGCYSETGEALSVVQQALKELDE